MERKAELKADFKHNGHKMRRMGVYRIENTANGKVFLAKSTHLDGAIERDKRWLSMGGHNNRGLQQDWTTYGPDAFRFEVLEVIEPTDEPRDWALEVSVLYACWMEELAPHGARGYMPAPIGRR
jgi:hypothetical protein